MKIVRFPNHRHPTPRLRRWCRTPPLFSLRENTSHVLIATIRITEEFYENYYWVDPEDLV